MFVPCLKKEIVSASDGDLAISPLLGMVIGAIFTLIIIVLLVAVRLRRSQNGMNTDEQKTVQEPQGVTSKPLLRSVSPRDVDEQDPDVIPAKYGEWTLT